MRRRIFDLAVAVPACVLTAPAIALASAAIVLEDGGSPFYRCARVGLGGSTMQFTKLRTMRNDPKSAGVVSTTASDPRVTKIGAVLRRWKLDELPQFWLVLRGDMAVVGPRPNVPEEVALYTDEERGLLDVLPGITDLSSIVFSDLSEILDGAADANLAYNQVVRPWKSRLGLLYAKNATTSLDWRIVLLTARSMVDRPAALREVSRIVAALGGGEDLALVCLRQGQPPAAPPPGANDVVQRR